MSLLLSWRLIEWSFRGKSPSCPVPRPLSCHPSRNSITHDQWLCLDIYRVPFQVPSSSQRRQFESKCDQNQEQKIRIVFSRTEDRTRTAQWTGRAVGWTDTQLETSAGNGAQRYNNNRNPIQIAVQESFPLATYSQPWMKDILLYHAKQQTLQYNPRKSQL